MTAVTRHVDDWQGWIEFASPFGHVPSAQFAASKVHVGDQGLIAGAIRLQHGDGVLAAGRLGDIVAAIPERCLEQILNERLVLDDEH
jgi:hypothetical protein